MTRGEIYAVRLPKGRGREQRGPRYGVIVQADELLELSTVLIAPTSRGAAAATFRPQIQLAGATTRVLVEQLRAVDLERPRWWRNAGALGLRAAHPLCTWHVHGRRRQRGRAEQHD